MTQDEAGNANLRAEDVVCDNPPLVEGHVYFDQRSQHVGVQINVAGDYHVVASGTSFIPLQRPPRATHFTGRDAELAALLADLHPGCIITLCGPGGVGKTALAAEVAWMLAPGATPPDRFPDGILYYTFYGRPDIALACEHIVRSYNPTACDTSFEAVQRLLSNKRALLILDGAEEAADLPALLDVCGACGILITTRSRRDAHADRRDIVPLSHDPAVALLRAWGGTCALDTITAGAICETVGRLPLAVRLAGRYLAQTGETANSYLTWLQTTPLDALDHGRRRLESVPVLLRKSLAQLSPEAGAALAVVSLLAPAPFDPAPLAAALDLSASALRKPLNELVIYGLLLRKEERYEVTHALIHTYAHAHLAPPEGGLLRLTTYCNTLARAQQDLGLPGYRRLAVERPHFLYVLRACAACGEWEAVNALAWTLTGSVSFLRLQGYWTDLAATIEVGLAAAQALRNRRDEGAHLSNLGLAYRDLGQVEKAITSYEQALVIARETGHRQGEGNCLSYLGSAYRALGQVEEAITYLEQALAIAREIGDRRGEGTRLGNLGSTYRSLGEIERAIAYHQQALDIAREIGDCRGESAWLGALGLAYHAQGRVEKAIAFYEQALDIAREIGDRQNEATWLGNLGNAYRDLGQVQKAVEYYEQSLVIDREIGYRQGVSQGLGCLGNAYHALGQVERAIEYYEQALAIAREIGHRRSASNALGYLGLAYSALGQVESAIELYAQALAIAREIGHRRGEGAWLGNLGNAYITLGQTGKARSYLQQARAIFSELKSPYTEQVCSFLETLNTQSSLNTQTYEP